MITTRSPAKPKIRPLFAKHTFDEAIRCHPRLAKPIEILALSRSQPLSLAHRKTYTFNERGLTAAPGAYNCIIKRAEFHRGRILICRAAVTGSELQAD